MKMSQLVKLFALFAIGLIFVTNQSATFSQTPIDSEIKPYCFAGSPKTWVNGESIPDISHSVEAELASVGIQATVVAQTYGKSDACGNFDLFGTDFTITINSEYDKSSKEWEDILVPILEKNALLNLGKIKVITLESDVFVFYPNLKEYDVPDANDRAIQTNAITQKLLIVVYDPILSNGQLLSEHLGWAKHNEMTENAITFFTQASHGSLNYVVAETKVLSDGWPELQNGFRYTEEQYFAVANGQQSPPSFMVNYNAIVNDPDLDICGRANRGEIDEVWIYNGPWFGFYESTLVGPNSYWFNSPPVPGPHTCERTIPIMGPSPERPDMLAHGEGHRMESTMSRVYGSWQQNRTSHSWEKFALVDALSVDYSYSGCGNIHFPANGTSDYDYGNTSTVNTNCHDFNNYPYLTDPLSNLEPISCDTWGCNHYGYMMYWFSHLPHNPGCGSDQVANNWWLYFADPALAINPSSACQLNQADNVAFISLGGNNSISVMNLDDHSVIRSGIAVGGTPHSMSFSPDGKRLYITNNTGNSLSVLDTNSYQVITTIPVGLNPRGVVSSHDGQYVYVANNASKSLSIINAETLEATEVSLTAHPEILALSNDGKYLFIPANTPASGFVFDTHSKTIIDNFNVGHANGITIPPQSNAAYITSAPNNVVVMDVTTLQEIKTIEVGAGPHRLTSSIDGSYVYVANLNSGDVSIINTKTNSIETTVALGSGAWAMDVFPEKARLYVPTSASNIAVIDTETNLLLEQIPLGGSPLSIAIYSQSIKQIFLPMIVR